MTAIELDIARLALDLAQWALTIGVGIFVWISSRHNATRTQIAEIEKAATEQINAHAVRLTKIETTIATMPTHDAVHELALSVKELAGEVKALTARHDGMVEVMKRVENVTNRQEEHLLSRAGKGQ